jgi:hypothetical protein
VSFAFGSFTLGAALLFSAFKNQTLISLILGEPGTSVASQGESHPSASGGSSAGGGSGGSASVANLGNIPKNIAGRIAKGVAAANKMAGRYPYSWGGGHDTLCVPSGAAEHGGVGFDCSGCWSCVLASMGVITAPMTSGEMASSFAKGPGKYITLYANANHVFGKIGGVWFATGSDKEAKRGGPAWGNNDAGNKREYTICHPKGF